MSFSSIQSEIFAKNKKKKNKKKNEILTFNASKREDGKNKFQLLEKLENFKG